MPERLQPQPSEWLRFFPRRRPRARVALVCVPPAGGGASGFAAWPASLPQWIEPCAVAVPGREARLHEPPARSLEALVAAIAPAVAALGLPVAVLGHSLGAWIGFELVRLLRAAAIPVVHFFPAAARPPIVEERLAADVDDRSLIAYLRELGGTPEAVLSDPALLDLVLPALRTDLALAAAHPARADPIAVPATILCGAADGGLPIAVADRWRELLGPGCERLVFPGGHFFLHSARDAVVAAIMQRVRPHEPRIR